jgi:hypothetical protein
MKISKNNRLRYLAEHKLSTDKISPKKIINWFEKRTIKWLWKNNTWRKFVLKLVN